jgi:uncharacterized protein DUF4342
MKERWESFRVKGDQVVSQVRRVIHEGNVRRVVIKQGARTIAEFPLSVGVVGALAAPALAAVGALAALLTDCTVNVQRAEEPASGGPSRSNLSRPRRKKAARKRAGA